MRGESQHSAIQQPCHRLPEVTPRSPDDCAHDGTRTVATATIGVIGLPGQAKGRERRSVFPRIVERVTGFIVARYGSYFTDDATVKFSALKWRGVRRFAGKWVIWG